MRRFYFVVWMVATACAHPARERSSDRDSVDMAVYKAVLDSMFTPRAESRFYRIAITDSTEVYKRENNPAVIASLLQVPGVDSAAARDFAGRSYQAHSLKGISKLRLRMPVLLLDPNALISLPRQEPYRYWKEFYERFPGTSGLISLSAIGYNADGNLGVLMVDVGCGGLCGNGYIVVVKRENGRWHPATIQGTWIS